MTLQRQLRWTACAALLMACGGGATEVTARNLNGDWRGDVAAAGARPATTVFISLTQDGKNTASGTATITQVGTLASYDAVAGVTSDGAVSADLLPLAGPAVIITVAGTLDGSTIRGTIIGGVYANDALTLTRR